MIWRVSGGWRARKAGATVAGTGSANDCVSWLPMDLASLTSFDKTIAAAADVELTLDLREREEEIRVFSSGGQTAM